MGIHSRRTARDAGGRVFDSGSRRVFSRNRCAKVNQLSAAVPRHSASRSCLATHLAFEALRPLNMLDKPLTTLLKYPYLSIGVVAVKNVNYQAKCGDPAL